MTGFGGAPPVYNNTIYVCNLPPGSDEELLAEHFGQLGLLKVISHSREFHLGGEGLVPRSLCSTRLACPVGNLVAVDNVVYFSGDNEINGLICLLRCE